MRSSLLVAAFILELAWPLYLAEAKIYYVKSSYNDLNPQITFDQLVHSLAELHRIPLKAGDVIVLDSDSTFQGPLRLAPGLSGTSTSPIEIRSSRKDQKATIIATTGSGIEIDGSSHLKIEGLRIIGPGGSENAKSVSGNGLEILNTQSSKHPEDISINDLRISGFRTGPLDGEQISRYGNGLLVLNSMGAPGIKNLKIQNVTSYDNSWSGIRVGTENYSPGLGKSENSFRHHGVAVSNCLSYSNSGIPHKTVHSGNGIVVSGVNGLDISNNTAHNNGKNNDANGGPVGIWAWDSDEVWVHDNLSHSNMSRSDSDGGGFDVDGGVTNGLVENNLSYNNAGPGYLLSTFLGSAPVNHTIVRKNVSINDGQKNNYGSLTASGDVRNSEFSENIIVLNHLAKTTLLAPYAERLLVKTSNVQVKKNIIATDFPPSPPVENGVPPGFHPNLAGNVFMSSGGLLNGIAFPLSEDPENQRKPREMYKSLMGALNISADAPEPATAQDPKMPSLVH